MQIEVESLHMPRREFADLCRELIESGHSFNETTLKAVPYSQLNLCCIGNAGLAACPPAMVNKEKNNRRERFLNMEPSEFKEAEKFLKMEQMYDDVMYAIACRTAPKWKDLNDAQKVVAKLTCLYNHVDNPADRMLESLNLLTRCSADPENPFPADVCTMYASKIRGMSLVFPERISDVLFRKKVAEIFESLLDFMPNQQKQVIEKEQLQDFSCTSDCFRVISL